MADFEYKCKTASGKKYCFILYCKIASQVFEKIYLLFCQNLIKV